MRGNTIALDLGTVNTCIYQLGAGVVLSEPSAVAYTAGTKKKNVTGNGGFYFEKI